MSETSRTTLLGVVVGLIALGAVFAFAVVLPEADGGDAGAAEEGAASDLGPIDLPDELDGGNLVAADSGALPPELVPVEEVDALLEQEASVADRLEAVYGVPAAFRLYGAADGTSRVELTAIDQAPGPFLPDLPPIDPALVGAARTAAEVVTVDDAVCIVDWGQAVPLGQPIDESLPPQGVRCQLGSGERTFQISAQGLTPDAAAALLADVAAA